MGKGLKVEVEVIPKEGLFCDVCGKLMTEKVGDRVVMKMDGILTGWGLYCVECYLKHGVRIRKGYEIEEHIEGGTDVTEHPIMKPTMIFFK